MIYPDTHAISAGMDNSTLKIALQVQTHGSIAGAARALNIDPSSVSRIVANVEARLGVRLFHRTTRQLTVTEEGQRFLSRIAPLVEELDAAMEEAKGARTLPSGLLRMTASVAFCYEVIVPLLPEFQQRYPKVTIDLRASDSNLDLLENGIDLAIRLAPAPHPSHTSIHLMHTRFIPVASPQYLSENAGLQKPQDLVKANCLQLALPGLQILWRFRLPGGSEIEIPLQSSLFSSSPLALRQAAVSGMGVALMTHWMIKDELKDGRLIELFPDYQCSASTEVWALCPSSTYVPRKARVMIDFMAKQIGGNSRNRSQ